MLYGLFHQKQGGGYPHPLYGSRSTGQQKRALVEAAKTQTNHEHFQTAAAASLV